MGGDFAPDGLRSAKGERTKTGITVGSDSQRLAHYLVNLLRQVIKPLGHLRLGESHLAPVFDGYLNHGRTINLLYLPCQAAIFGIFFRLAALANPPSRAISRLRFALNFAALALPPFLPPRFQAACRFSIVNFIARQSLLSSQASQRLKSMLDILSACCIVLTCELTAFQPNRRTLPR